MFYNLPEGLKSKCLDMLNAREINNVGFVGGGDINEARLIETDKGRFFLKMNDSAFAHEMFIAEAKGLNALKSAGILRVPEVIGHGKDQHHSFLLLEFIERGYRRQTFWEEFGEGLAALHRFSAQEFGFDEDNFIGSLPQSNNRHSTWADFYVHERLEPQIRMAIDAHKLSSADTQDFKSLYKLLPSICPEEQASLLHGDLWSGNFMSGPDGEPVLIDPSVSYAHRELDLAMSRLFGGFERPFYAAYEEHYPLAPGFEKRLPVYQLYYLLVHVNLFGGGYVRSVRNVLSQFT
jgi:hypothetical protein